MPRILESWRVMGFGSWGPEKAGGAASWAVRVPGMGNGMGLVNLMHWTWSFADIAVTRSRGR